ncbi:MAG: hypothetical protein M1833_000513 [Piccolia ochrophora]|nr:MAG: hypothetical protein M1833_000513 [Piccolia ochrophora]
MLSRNLQSRLFSYLATFAPHLQIRHQHQTIPPSPISQSPYLPTPPALPNPNASSAIPTMLLRPLLAHSRPRARALSTTAVRRADFTHTVIGGGVVGLAIARQLAGREGTSTLLVERHEGIGTETSSRNSEVIHAGLYYPRDSLKTRLCVAGKDKLYALCDKQRIPYRRTGKWIVSQSPQQTEHLENLHAHAESLDIPTRFVPHEEARRREPAIHFAAEAGGAVLESPTTGIIDSHALMLYLQGAFEDAGGDTAFLTNIAGIEAVDGGKEGYRIDTRTVSGDDGGETESFTTETLVNAAGLGACKIANMLLPAERRVTPYYAKGTYYSYSASTPKTNVLVYPAPEPGQAGLGTHLTLDLAGRIRFGPDVEWVDSADNLAATDDRLPAALEAVKQYLPEIDPDALAPDYAGIRPKLGKSAAAGGTKGFEDFVIQREQGFEGWINLLGIESPGLTSALTIAEMVDDLLYR